MATLTLEEGLYTYLSTYAGLTSLISTRIYPNRVPQSTTLPCLTFQRISTTRVKTHDSSGSAGTAHPRIQFDAWATTYTSAKAITDQLRAALNGYKGTITSGANSVVIQGALVDNETSEPDIEAGLERIRSDYIIWVQEA